MSSDRLELFPGSEKQWGLTSICRTIATSSSSKHMLIVFGAVGRCLDLPIKSLGSELVNGNGLIV